MPSTAQRGEGYGNGRHWKMDSNTDFKVIGENGTDITDELCVKRVRIDCSATEPTTIVLDCYGEAEVDAENIRLLLDKVSKKP